MRRAATLQLIFAALLLNILPFAGAHGHDEHGAMDMGSATASTVAAMPSSTQRSWDAPMSYFVYSDHSGWMIAHISLMVLAWFFILPIGVMLSVARSHLALPTQFSFLVLNALGVLFGTVYNVKTPDLYENNVHHKIGWIATWVMSAQVIMGLVFLYARRSKRSHGSNDERAAFLPVSVEAMAHHEQAHAMRGVHEYRWSGDSGQGTERASSSSHSRSISPTREHRAPQALDLDDKPEDEEETEIPNERRYFRNSYIDKFLSRRIPGLLSQRLLKMMEVVYAAIDRLVLILGFIAIATGAVTYGGIFRGRYIFSGLAHSIKGGIFFWYGLLTLGRWMGCFADFGWAWNVKPSRAVVGQWKASIPSAEFTESFVIWLYGTTNVFLEHLAGWGGAWSAQDIEHVSISIMFFGGGLCGMLIESKRVRELLNTNILVSSAGPDVDRGTADAWQSPKSYSFPMNPLPGLIILLLGLMMSSHHQDSMVSTMMHSQWGTLLVGFSLARAVTYILFFLSPPSSLLPSRPPSEIISAFCLISGGLIFMASNEDIVNILEVSNLNAMIVFTVTMGFTAFLMAWEITLVAIKGWAERKESASRGVLRFSA